MQPPLELGNAPKNTKTGNLRPEELLQRNSVLEAELVRVLRENYELRNLKINDEQIQFLMQEQIESLR